MCACSCSSFRARSEAGESLAVCGSHYCSGFGVESIISEEPVSDFFFKIKGLDESQISS